MTLQIARIILPAFDNDGESLQRQRDDTAMDLLSAFGGYTRTETFGAWVNEHGQTVYDHGYAYGIAGDWSDPSSRATLRDIAAVSAEDMRQDCIFVSFPHGVEFIEASANAIAA